MKLKGVMESSSNGSDITIATSTPLGKHLEKLGDSSQVSFLMFNKQKLKLVDKMTIGRASECSIVIDSKLVSRLHASIQKIKDYYFLKDEGSTNGTFLNGTRIPNDKFLKLNPGDKITIGNETVVMS